MSPAQQPFWHVVELQTHCPFVEPLHICPVGSGHAMHAAPAVPHEALDCDA